MKKNVLVYALLALLAMAVGLGAVYFLRKEKVVEPARPVVTELPKADPDPVPEQEAQELAQQADVNPGPEEPEITAAEEPSVSHTQEEAPAAPVLVISSAQVEAVSEDRFRVSGLKVRGASEAGVTYELFDRESHKYYSDSGVFENIEANSSGAYMVRAIDKETKLNSQVRTLKGFALQKPVDRLSATDLAKIFNTGNAGELEEYRARFVDTKRCRITCNHAEITTLSQVFQAVSMEGYTATVSNIQYDANGRIKSLTVSLD